MFQVGLRHRDDMIFFIKPGQNAQNVRHKLEDLKKDLNIKEAKTSLIKSSKVLTF